MASEVEICNMALSQVRAGSINNLDQTTPQAQQCKLWYAHCRDMVLQEMVWNFSRRIDALALLTDAEVFNWRYVYAYPNDCMNIIRVIPNISIVSPYPDGGHVSPTAMRMNDTRSNWLDSLPEVEYQVMNVGGSQVVVCNEADARVDYKARITNVNKFSPQFIIALANLLASFIAVPLVGVGEGRKLKSDALDAYSAIISMAGVNNANEGKKHDAESEYITVRN